MSKISRLGALCAAAVMIAAPAFAQQMQTQTVPENAVREVINERICKDGMRVVMVRMGPLVMVEFFSAPKPNGAVSGYQNAYDLTNIEEAQSEFDGWRCAN